MDRKDPLTYQQAGVDPEKAGAILGSFARFLKTRPRDPAVMSGIGPFASCYSLKEALNRFRSPVLVTCCDGVGTKAKLALQWEAIDRLGEDLVAMNVNDLLCAGATPVLFLDYYACGSLREDQLMPLLKSIQQGCELARCSLVGGETAEMPGVYAGEDFDLAGFAVGLADEGQLLGPARVKAGDTLLALEGRGPHSNGFSLIRKILERENLKPDARPPFGKQTWREHLLQPTPIYVTAILPSLPRLNALAHLTGGGLFENLPRVLPEGTTARIDPKRWEIPPLFRWLQEKASLSETQLLSTFNAGVGMIAVCAPEHAREVEQAIGAHGVRCWPVGTVERTEPGRPAAAVWG
jgi:phosphoribosylformylglycinamidine cyclo-ligase